MSNYSPSKPQNVVAPTISLSRDEVETVIRFQLHQMRLPESLHNGVLHKLDSQVFDAGSKFTLAKLEGNSGADEDEEAVKSESKPKEATGEGGAKTVPEGEEGEQIENDSPSVSTQSSGALDPEDSADGTAAVSEQLLRRKHRTESALGLQTVLDPLVLISLTNVDRGSDAWLVDHFWTFRAADGEKALASNKDLLSRVENVLGIGKDDLSLPLRAHRAYQAAWLKVHSYRLGDEVEPTWFLMDEVGTAVALVGSEPYDAADGVGGGDDLLANVRMGVVYDPRLHAAFTVMWPICNISEGDVIKVALEYCALVGSPGPRRSSQINSSLQAKLRPFSLNAPAFTCSSSTVPFLLSYAYNELDKCACPKLEGDSSTADADEDAYDVLTFLQSAKDKYRSLGMVYNRRRDAELILGDNKIEQATRFSHEPYRSAQFTQALQHAIGPTAFLNSGDRSNSEKANNHFTNSGESAGDSDSSDSGGPPSTGGSRPGTPEGSPSTPPPSRLPGKDEAADAPKLPTFSVDGTAAAQQKPPVPLTLTVFTDSALVMKQVERFDSHGYPLGRHVPSKESMASQMSRQRSFLGLLGSRTTSCRQMLGGSVNSGGGDNAHSRTGSGVDSPVSSQAGSFGLGSVASPTTNRFSGEERVRIQFQSSGDPTRAHIIWAVHRSPKSSDEFPEAFFINHFPEGAVFTNKAGLCRAVRDAFSPRFLEADVGFIPTWPRWLPATYDASDEAELQMFIGHWLNNRSAQRKLWRQSGLTGEAAANAAASGRLVQQYAIGGRSPDADSTSSASSLQSPVDGAAPSTPSSAFSGGALGASVGESPAAAADRPMLQKDNLWIVKAPDLARSLDQTISGELVSLLRLSTSNGPKLISEYISRPVTLRQRKFDLRFVVLVTGLRPCLELFIYDKFRVRCASEPYRLEDFGNFARHWTAMNHSANSASGEVSAERRVKINCKDFANELNDEATWRMERRHQKHKAMHQHHHHHQSQKPEDVTPALAAPPTPVDVWTPTYNQIKRMMKELFSCFETVGGEDVSRRTHSRFRAMYGVDVLLRDRTDDDDEETWKKDGYDPLLLEITYSPDVSQECEDEPKFFEGAFCTLFLDQPRLFSRI